MTESLRPLEALKIERKPSARRRRKWLVPAAVVLVLGGLLTMQRIAAARPLAVMLVTPTVQVGGPKPGTPVLNASGYLVPRRKAVVSAKVQGRLAELRVEEGAEVGRGDVIARLESADVEAQVARAQAAISRNEADRSEARRQLELSERMLREGVGNSDARDAAQSRLRIADAAVQQSRADLQLAQAQLDNTVIRAPFSGTVLRRMAEVGESVAPIPPGVNLSTSSGAIVALADLATLETEVDVAEANVAMLRPMNDAEITVEAVPDRRYRGVLRQVTPAADRTKATVTVKVTLLEKSPELKPEMSAKVAFLRMSPSPEEAERFRQQTEITIPSTAVLTVDGKDGVFVVSQGRAEWRSISIGDRRGAMVVVQSGLQGQESLVVEAPEGLKVGRRVVSKGS